MENQQFVQRLHDKIERLTEGRIDLEIDIEDGSQLRVELERETPLVVLGSNIFEFSGFARMCVEYAVESIRKQRPHRNIGISPVAGPQLTERETTSLLEVS
tara:strand:- start:221 stop:523 length:303 start_codon:yes stop_codon:yes gene_type:complete